MRGAAVIAAMLLGAGCQPTTPCETSYFRRVARSAGPFAGHWVVVRGDTVTLPEGMGLPFKLTDAWLDTVRVTIEAGCFLRGRLAFAVPGPDTLAVAWLPSPEGVLIFGWPAELGPFAGVDARLFAGGDSLTGALLFDERLDIQVAPGVTARFVAARAR